MFVTTYFSSNCQHLTLSSSISDYVDLSNMVLFVLVCLFVLVSHPALFAIHCFLQKVLS